MRITPVIALTIGLLVGAGLLGALQLFLLGFPLAAVAVLMAGLALAALAWKLQVSALTSKKVERRVNLLANQVGTAVPVPAAPATATAPAASPERSTLQKLTDVGVFEPAKAFDGAGRAAAAVTVDPDAPYRLFAATNGMGAPAVSPSTRRPIALIGSNELAEKLAGHGTVHRLHPNLSAAELEHSRPTALVVEEDALDRGAWFGALHPQGSRLLLEIRVAMAWMRRNGGAIYVLAATGMRDPAADAMRADTILIDDELSATIDDETPRSLLTALSAYRQGAGE